MNIGLGLWTGPVTARAIAARALLICVLAPAFVAMALAQPIDPVDRTAAFRRFAPDYDRHVALYRPAIEDRAALLLERERRGAPSLCAQQILREAQWLVGATTAWERLVRRLAALDAALAGEDVATEAQDEDGAWGRCYTEPFLKLDASYDNIAALSRQGLPPPRRSRSRSSAALSSIAGR